MSRDASKFTTLDEFLEAEGIKEETTAAAVAKLNATTGKFYDEKGVELRGKLVDIPELTQRLRAMSGSTAAQQAADYIERVQRLLFPVKLGMIEMAMAGEPVPENARIFSFMGSGASDFTYMAEFRALFGDERKEMEEAQVEYEKALVEEQQAHERGECTQHYGCLNAEHKGSCGYSTVNPAEDTDLEKKPELDDKWFEEAIAHNGEAK